MLNRRNFLSAAAAAAALAPREADWLGAAEAAGDEQRFKKAVKIGMVQVDAPLVEKFKLLKSLGFDGVELNSPGGPSPDEVKRAIDESGLPVHGVVDSVHWRDTLSHPDPEVRQRGLAALKAALQDCKAYGGTSVLLVPAKVDEMASYQQCWERSIPLIKQALPLAEELEIHVLMENVWNDFLTDPAETARYIDELESPMAGAYFDVGNAVRYSPPHEWIPVLGKRIVKLDIKEFDLTKEKSGGRGAGFRVELLEGDCNWPQVIEALKRIGFRGWGTAEIPGGGRERLAEIARRMDRIYAS